MHPVELIEQARGRVSIETLGPQALHFVVEGMLDETLAQALTARGHRIAARGHACALHDWSRVEGYTSAARTHLTGWLLQYRQDFDVVHVLVRSTIVAMGVNVANLALGGFLRAGTDDDVFAQLVDGYRRRGS